jgi:transcription antitermination factor NusG
MKYAKYSSPTLPVLRQSNSGLTPVRVAHHYDYGGSILTSPTLLFASKLWDRLQIEEDDEPMWYLLNCVATNEIDLLRQCRQVFANMDDPTIQNDVIKFVVPIEKKTRSHGANKMVTETKVKYPGYVFAKLRLCPIVYETIQGLDLCRSWMGTVNHKGYKKLPPAPLALNEDEIENFGLEDVIEDIDDDDTSNNESNIAGKHTIDADGIIVDSSEDDENDIDDEEYSDPMYKNVDKKSLKQYRGLKVEDMVKVIQKGKFYNEDGIVRRLKDGQIFVRFYTYGTMFEEWLSPNDVRKLSPEEVLRGLSGSTQPITQKDFDERNGLIDPNRPMDVRDALRSTPGSALGSGERNRRQDRIADRFKSSNNNNVRKEQWDAEKNWNWYKEQQQQKTKKQDSVVGVDNEWTIRAGSNDESRNNRWMEGDEDSQWGRKPQRPIRKVERQTSLNSERYKQNRLTEAAIDGTADWSAFVTPSIPSKKEFTAEDKSSTASDDFFDSLMSDLKKDLPVVSTQPGSSNHQPQQQYYQTQNKELRQPQSTPNREFQNTAAVANSNDADDFFSSLMSDLNKDIGGPTNQWRSGPAKQPVSTAGEALEDDFLASLVSDLATNAPTSTSSSMSDSLNSADDAATSFMSDLNEGSSGADEWRSGKSGSIAKEWRANPWRSGKGGSVADEWRSGKGGSVANQWRSGQAPVPAKKPVPSAGTASEDDFFSSLISDLVTSPPTSTSSSMRDSSSLRTSQSNVRPNVIENYSSGDTNRQDDDFFASLEAELESTLRINSVGSKDTTSPDVPVTQTPSTTVELNSRPSRISSSDLEKNTIPVLKDMLRERGLKVSGTKPELINRLLSS